MMKNQDKKNMTRIEFIKTINNKYKYLWSIVFLVFIIFLIKEYTADNYSLIFLIPFLVLIGLVISIIKFIHWSYTKGSIYIKCFSTFFICFLFIGIPILFSTSDSEKIEAALELGRLAPLPISKKELRVETAGNMFSRTFFVYFKSSVSHINKWIKKSNSFTEMELEKFNENSMLLPYLEFEKLSIQYTSSIKCNPSTGDVAAPKEPFSHQYFFINERFPWFYPAIKKNGRRYKIPQDSNSNGGEIVINDETGEVYIRVSHS